jgi:hypothetical protein
MAESHNEVIPEPRFSESAQHMCKRVVLIVILACAASSLSAADNRHAVPKEHPRLFGNLAHLQALAQSRADVYKRMAEFARGKSGRDYPDLRIPAMALVSAIEHDAQLGKQAVEMVMPHVNGPIKVGHVTFGHDLAQCAIVYDLCYECWTADERAKFIEYMNKTVDQNVKSESSVFHNGYYGYKNWGIGLACYATYYENPHAPEYLKTLEADVRARAEPALELAGGGGSWAEGHYVHYWIYEWLVFCEVARTCEGIDYYSHAPKFYQQRAIASMFEMFPGNESHLLNCPIPIGDGGTGLYGGYSEKILSARRILGSYYRDDPANQVANAYNALVPTMDIPEYVYEEFLWKDTTATKGNLKAFKLSHCSQGPGYVFARSSWDGDATYLFFKCGDRFTAHQHLDVGTFTIFKETPLVMPGGFYDNTWNDSHCLNYYTRSIGANTMLIFDPSEKFPDGIRAGGPAANDGGQDYPKDKTGWGQNGGSHDVEMFKANSETTHIAELLAYDDQGAFLYTAGDCTKAYSSKKLDFFTRQIVYIRPNTFVIFDRVQSKNPNFKKTFLLHTMAVPSGSSPELVMTHGKGKLFIQPVLPAGAHVKLNSGKDLYSYNGGSYPPSKEDENVPKCRIEISPAAPAATDYFLNVLTAGDASSQPPPKPEVKVGSDIEVTIGSTKVRFKTSAVGGSIELNGSRTELASRVAIEPLPPVKTNTPAAPVVSADAPKAAPAVPVSAVSNQPSAEEKGASEKRYAELRAAIIQGTANGKKFSTCVDLYGSPTNCKVVAANENEVGVEVEGIGDNFKVPWNKLNPSRFYGIARGYTDDHLALYEYCRGAGLAKEADSEACKKQ